MAYTVEKNIPRAEVIRSRLPLSQELKERVMADREELFEIFEGRSKKKLLIIGPCSAWPAEAVIDYAQRLKAVCEKVQDKIKIVLRVYTQKPRTTIGWTGSMNQPNPLQDPDIEEGILYCRKMMLNILNIGLPLADEAVFTHNEGYVADLLSWVAIGARSSEDQEHRLFASMIDHPVGIKNPTSGNIPIGVNSVIAAQHPHTFLLHSQQIHTTGNPHAHLVLRGGASKANISKENITRAAQLLQKTKNPSILIDCSHENSIDETGKKNPQKQPRILLDLLPLMKEERSIKGFMIESFIKEGKQSISEKIDRAGLSITDGCIDWESTERLILDFYAKLSE